MKEKIGYSIASVMELYANGPIDSYTEVIVHSAKYFFRFASRGETAEGFDNGSLGMGSEGSIG
jgi:hypothetical protein